MNILFNLLIILFFFQNNSFLDAQLKYARVRTAKAQKDSVVKDLFISKNLNYPPKNIFIRVFKAESVLELWAKDHKSDKYILVNKYDICALSGKLGPKRKRGDLQIPEGFYYISLFNPVSNFYLSLKINYPNKSDRILGYKQNLGGDIFVHGDCVTIGCIPITDEKIKELYWIAVLARHNGQDRIPVHIFPTRLDGNNLSQLKTTYKNNQYLIKFWKNLKTGYDHFEKSKALPEITVDKSGYYVLEGQD